MPDQSPASKIILASSSRYRRALLERLGLPFECESPCIDEAGRAGEPPGQLVTRLAREKAQAVAGRFPAAAVIGSDQLATFGDRIIGKAGSAERARSQLAEFSGQTVRFLSAVCVVRAQDSFLRQWTVPTDVVFRELGRDEIERYVELEQPLDCAGSFKSEAAGISLFSELDSKDPTALVGLPLISLSAVLRELGFQVP
jgi:septum formation protein